MEWLRKIIESAEIEDGEIKIDEVMKQINAEFPKNAIPKPEFNSVNEQLKTANATIKELEKSNKDNEDLQAKIKGYETEIAELKANAETKEKELLLKAKLNESGVVDADYLIYKQGGVDKFVFNDKNEPIGVDDILKEYKEKTPHLFKAAEQAPHYNPKKGEGNGGSNPWLKESFNLTKQGEMFKENPAQARELAAQAGITI